MKRITILILPALLLCAILSGCIASSGGGNNTTPTTVPAETEIRLPEETRPLPTPTLPIETIPKSTDDSDYQLPPGERPTLTPEDK